MDIRSRIGLVALLLSVGTAAFAQEAPTDLPEYTIQRAAGPIVVDGVLAESSWQAATPVSAFLFPWPKEGEKEPTDAWMVWDDDNLYVAFVAHDKHISSVLTNRDDPVSNDDCVEVFIAPDPDAVENYQNYEMNVLGTLLDRFSVPEDSIGWKSEGVQIGIVVDGTVNDESDEDVLWTTEVAIPFANFEGVAKSVPPADGDTWRLNLYRIGGAVNPQYSVWSDTQTPTANYHVPERFGVVQFSAEPVAAGPPTAAEALAAMKRATDFMMNTVSTKGGFVDRYTEDLSERWGEVPARDSMIWVQDPGTVTVGEMLLDVYRATGDAGFLAEAKRTADALVLGQHPKGGWHYFIDFDAAGTPQWYEEVGSKCWGWEEFYHYYGNCTYDDDATTGAARFLLDLYMTTLDPAYRAPLDKALAFILESQYPIGGWPQRYPLRYDHPDHGHPDYTSCLTFNDSVTVGNIFFLLDAYHQLGNEAYKEAAMRGMYFVVISQLGAPQAGWAQQYYLDLTPAGARSFEPQSVCTSTTHSNIRQLMTFYKMTGDRRFLRGIPDALDWLANSYLPPGHSDDGHTHAQFVELGTNKPLYAHREGTSREDGRYWVDYEPGNFPGHYGMQSRVDVDALRKEYLRVAALSPEEAMAEYAAQQDAVAPPQTIAPETARAILDGLDARGAWVEDLSVPDYLDWKYRPRRHFRGISTRTYVRNMRVLAAYVEGREK